MSQTAFDILDAAPSADVHLSAASVWELEIKRSVGKYSGLDLLVAARENGFSLVALTAEHGQAAGALPPHHRDPFDRMLVIQAQMLGLPLISVDPQIALYDVTTIG